MAVTTVMATGLLFGMTAITVDASRFYLAKRRQQGMADLAAVAAAANLAQARAAAAASLAANGMPAASLVSVELGTYAADPAVPAALRFTAGAASPNAARVTLASGTSAVFAPLVGAAKATVGARSVAVNADVAAFALGSTLARFDAGSANAILGALTGSTLTLTAGDYSGLSAADVNLFGLADALAVRVGATGTYAALAATSVRVADVLNAAADAVSAAGTSPSAAAALRAVATAIGPSGPKVAFGGLVGFGAYGGLALGSPPPASAALPALALASAAARLGAGGGTLSAALGGTPSSLPPGIATATVGMAFGIAAGSSYAAIGPGGTTIHTAQTRVLLTLGLGQLGTTKLLTLPLYVETGPATATLSAVGCSAGAAVDPAATLAVTPGLVDAWIGNVGAAALADLRTPVAPGPAALTSVQLLLASTTISGRAHATIADTRATAVPFTRADVAAGTMKSTSTTDYAGSLLSRLFGSLQLSASQTVLGVEIPVALPAGVASPIATLLQADLGAIDQALSDTLATLGLTVGDADTWVRAVRCGQGVLVN